MYYFTKYVLLHYALKSKISVFSENLRPQFPILDIFKNVQFSKVSPILFPDFGV